MQEEHPFLRILSCSARLFVNDAMATFVKLDYRKNIITIQAAKNISLRISATDTVHGMFLSLSTLMHFDMRRRIESWFWRKCVIPLPLSEDESGKPIFFSYETVHSFAIGFSTFDIVAQQGYFVNVILCFSPNDIFFIVFILGPNSISTTDHKQ